MSRVYSANRAVVTSVNGQTGAVQIGGRNLVYQFGGLDHLDGTYLGLRVQHAIGKQEKYVDLFTQNLPPIHIKPNTCYTLSFYIKGTGQVTSHLYNLSSIVVSSGKDSTGSTTSFGDGTIWHTVPSTWTKYSVTWLTRSDAPESAYLVTVRIPLGRTDVEVYVTEPKLEEGTVATDWSLAPESIERRLAALEAKVGITADEPMPGPEIMDEPADHAGPEMDEEPNDENKEMDMP